MTTRNGWMMVALGWLVMASAGNSLAYLISWEYFDTRAGVEALFGTDGVTTVATGQFRAGGDDSPEIRVQNGEMDLGQPFDQGNLVWDIDGGNNSLSAGFGGPLAGDFQLEATGSGGTTDSAVSLPTDWFNQVLVDIHSDNAIIDIFGSVNGEGFNIGTDPSTSNPDDYYDAMLFTFDNAEGTTPEWGMSANMSMTTPYLGLTGDDFYSDVYQIQNFNVVPEPATFGLFGLGTLILGVWSQIRRRLYIDRTCIC